MTQARLVLADGTSFEGQAFGARGEIVGEVVFNTSMMGYQEILTDPSYVGQIVTMSYPHIGNVGSNSADEESSRPHALGMVVRELGVASNYRSSQSLHDYLASHQRVGIEGIDTRKLVRHLRTHGSQMGVLSTENISIAALKERAQKAPSMEGLDLATGISTPKPFVWEKPTPNDLNAPTAPRTPSLEHHVVAIDYGLKNSMLQFLVDQGCKVMVVPSHFSAEQILAYRPKGIFLTNGPGDPQAVAGAQKTVSGLLGKVPLFGICLGHQILALALGAKTYKMKFGHRGANQPVMDLQTGKIEITAQNHGFAVDASTLPKSAQVTHRNLNDQTVEGLVIPEAKAFSVQYHPEASPGPHDARHLFLRFTRMLDQG